MGIETTIRPRITVRVPRGAESEYYFGCVSALISEHLKAEIDSVAVVDTPGFRFGLPVLDKVEEDRLVRRFLRRGAARLLLVDDDADYTAALRPGLERLFAHVHIVNRPLDALAVVSKNPDAYHVVVVDLCMSGLDESETEIDAGIVLIKYFSGLSANLAIVANTAHQDEIWRRRALEAGALSFRTKYGGGLQADREVDGVYTASMEALSILGYQVS